MVNQIWLNLLVDDCQFGKIIIIIIIIIITIIINPAPEFYLFNNWGK